MLHIQTFEEFNALPPIQKADILKSLKVKVRLHEYLEKLNDRESFEAHWAACNSCRTIGHTWKSPRDNSGVHPSAVDGCMKKIWYCCSGMTELAVKHVNPRLRLIFAMGTAWHDVMQAYGEDGAWGSGYVKEAAIDPEAKDAAGNYIQPVANEWWIKGHVDAVIPEYIIETGTLGTVSIKTVHEYKTINSNGYSKLTRPKEAHKYQATVYGAVFDAPVVVYLYTNKDNCHMVDFPVAFDIGLWTRIKEKIEQVQEYVHQEVPPPWTLTSSVMKQGECIGCDYLSTCKPPHLNK